MRDWFEAFFYAGAIGIVVTLLMTMGAYFEHLGESHKITICLIFSLFEFSIFGILGHVYDRGMKDSKKD